MSRHTDPNPATRAQKAKAISDVAFKSLAAILVIGQLIAIIVLVVRQDSNTKKTDRTVEVLHILLDCTTPGHACYDRANKATSDAVASLNRVTILASSCAATLPDPTPNNVKRCVLAHLK